MRKQLPDDLSFAGLFAPCTDHAYFEGAADLPFLTTGDFFWRNAWFMAEASLLSYVEDETFVRDAWARAGFLDVALVSVASGHAHVASSADATIVAFRGTEGIDLEDWKTNLRFALKPSETAGFIHAGFDAAYEELDRELGLALRGRPPAWFCGHSLGGALATLTAARRPARALYTFGSPRVGTVAFRDAFRIPAYRLVNNADVVSQLPPFPYRHVGERIVFDETGRAHRAPPAGQRWLAQIRGLRRGLEEAVAAWRSGDWRALGWRALIDHGPRRYAILTWNAFWDSDER